MAQITITINSREYAVACDDGQERYMLQLARLLDEKAKQLTAGGGHINENMLLAMVGLLVADELTETRKKLEKSKENLQLPEVKIIPEEKVVEKVVEPDYAPLDAELAGVLNQLTEQIKTLANEIESM